MSDSPNAGKSELLDELLGDFLDESDQLLTQLNRNLLQLDEWVQALADDHDEHCDESLMNEMFRAAHSLKGLSGMLGLSDINQLTHKIENVFDAARHGQLVITRDVTDLVFMGVDQLVAMVGLLKEPGGDPVDCEAVLESIRRILQKAGAEKKMGSQAEAEGSLADSPASAPPETPTATLTSCPLVSNEDPLRDVSNDEQIPEKYLSMFIDEAELSLEGFSAALMALEGNQGDEELRRLLGIAHKVKGSAASVGLNRIAKLAHLVEDLLEDLVASNSVLTPRVTDVLLKCIDGLQQSVADLKSGKPGLDTLGSLGCALVALRQEPLEAERTVWLGHVVFQPGFSAAPMKAQLICEKLTKCGELLECAPRQPELDRLDELAEFRFRCVNGLTRDALLSQVRLAGVVEVHLDSESACPAQPAATAQPTAAITPSAVAVAPQAAGGAARASPPAPIVAEVNGGEAVPTHEEQPVAKSGCASKQRGAPTTQRATETVRVDTERLDHLMDLAGQLVINRAQFVQIGDRLKTVVDCHQSSHTISRISSDLERLGSSTELRLDDQHSGAELEIVRGQIRRIRNDMEPLRREIQTLGLARECARELFEAIHQLDRVSDGIQKGVMDIRMVSVGPLFARFSRVVRDISRASGKQIRLDIAGEKTELDKRMIDELGDPLVHLVRNSADHGIEAPEERDAVGKPRQGVVTLEAFHRGNSIVIEVRDDGKGLDTDRILRKALDKGLINEADAQRMTPRQVQQLIWEPGLSTAQKITDISGRGMGMDIVKTKIEELSGTVEVFSVQGQGTTITIKLPLTLAILPSLMVDISRDVFAMPMEAVVEIVSIGAEQVSWVHGHPMAVVRGRVIPLVKLREVLNFHSASAEGVAPRAAETTLVVVADGGREIALTVDQVIGEGDVVIKSIAENYRNVAGIAGATIRGDGRVALILDIPALIDSMSRTAVEAK